MTGPDWTVAYDDLLTMRWQRCIFCSGEAQRVELRSTARAARTMAVCTRCWRAKETERRLQALAEAHDPQRTHSTAVSPARAWT